VLGLVREIVAANYFGARGPINAFTVAFQIPNLVARSSPTPRSPPRSSRLQRAAREGEKARAWRVASTVFWLFLLVVGGSTALFILARRSSMPPLDRRLRRPAVTLSQILFPIVVLLGALGIVDGILNSYDAVHDPGADAGRLEPRDHRRPRRRRAAADTETASSTSTPARSSSARDPVAAAAAVAARARRPPRLALDMRDPACKQVFKLMVPVMLGLGLINVNAVIGTLVASQLIDPTSRRTRSTRRSASTCSRRGCSRSRSRPSSSRRSRGSPRAATSAASRHVSRGLRQINFLLCPRACLAVLAEPIVRLLYSAARSSRTDDGRRAALAAFSLGLTFNGMMLMLNRGFFSLQQPWVPTVDRAREPRAERALYASSTASARGGSRSRSRLPTSPVSHCCSSRSAADRPDRPDRDDPLVRPVSRSPPRCSARSPSARGTCSTTRSAARSPRSSSRSAPRSSLVESRM
jgi:putative peptidoglycan lipid II flippase